MLKQRASKSLRSHSEEQRTAVYSFSLPLLHLHRRVRSKTIKRWYSFSCTCCYSSHQCKDIDRAEEGEKSPHQCIYCQYRHICELRLLTWSYLFIRTKYKYILPISLSLPLLARMSILFSHFLFFFRFFPLRSSLDSNDYFLINLNRCGSLRCINNYWISFSRLSLKHLSTYVHIRQRLFSHIKGGENWTIDCHIRCILSIQANKLDP